MSIYSHGQDPWPLERQDRYGTARALSGPAQSDLTTPWISNRLGGNFPVSHGPSIRADGVGFFGNWAANLVYKFNTATGAILGSFQALNFVACTPAIGPSGMAIVSTDNPNGKVFGIDTQIMDFNWFKQTGYVGGSPNIGPEGDTIFGTGGGSIYRLASVTGAQIWNQNGYGPTNGTIVFSRNDNEVIVSQGNFVTSLDWSDGSHNWSTNLGSRAGRPAVAPNGTIIVGSLASTIYALHPDTGAVLWTWSTLDSNIAAAAFSPDGTVAYVPSNDHRLYAMRVSDGVRLWSYTTSLWIEHGGVVDALGRIYVHNKAGDLYCISPSGNLIWSVRLNGEARGPLTIGPDATLYVGYSGSTSGLAVIRQLGIPLAPTNLTMEKGSILSGGLNQVLVSDNDRVVFGKGFITNAQERPIRAIFSTVTPLKPVSQINVRVESRADLAGVSRWLELWNFSMSRWDQIATSSEGLADSVLAANVVNAGSYADSGGQIRLRVSWKETGPVARSNWQTSVDFVHFAVAPVFVP